MTIYDLIRLKIDNAIEFRDNQKSGSVSGLELSKTIIDETLKEYHHMISYTNLIMDKIPGKTPKEKFEAIERIYLPDGQVNYEAVILINCIRLLGKDAQGRLIRNLIERGAEYNQES